VPERPDGPLSFRTADLCDAFSEALQVAGPWLRDFGAARAFRGPIATVSVLEDNALVRAALEEEGLGRVLVVDGGGSTRCALVGDRLAAMAAERGWAGIVVNGCVRDSLALATVPIGIKALATSPRRPGKSGTGARDVPVEFAGVTFRPGHFLYADQDGIVVAEGDLLTSAA
jgi:regulator of ribonuclease activity A